MTRWLSVALAGLLVALPTRVAAQPIGAAPTVAVADPAQPAAQAKPARPGAAAPQPAPPPPPAAPAPTPVPVPMPPTPPPPPGRMVNLQLEFTITDQTGAGAADKKVVSMMASNGTWGRIRATGTARPRGNAPLPVVLNVDARAVLGSGDTIQTEITIEYRPVGASLSDEPTRADPTVLNQSLTVLLQNGKPMVISQAADPVTDRKIVVEAKATVQK